MLNQVILEGNLTADGIARGTAEHPALAFSIANNQKIFNKNTDSYDDAVTFFDCVIFGKRAKALKEYLIKGSKVVVIGRLDINYFENKDGALQKTPQIIVNELSFMSRKKDAQNNEPWN